MATSEPKTRDRRILVIDDEPASAELARDWYAARSVEIIACNRGEQGLEIARGGDIDVILLDLRMPGMNGIEVAQSLRADSRTRTIPIILLTACRDVESKVEAFRVGADDYVIKPFAVEELNARIDTILSKRECLVGLESQVEDLESSNHQLEQLLMVDEKTGLYNFREFQRRLREEWQRAERYSVPLSVVFFDLDHFKRVNDTLGHQAGDRVLKEFAMLATGGARANDIAARYGGEEFAIILPHTDGIMATRVAERIRRAVQEFVFDEAESPIRITVSAGVATLTSKREVATVDDLVRAADAALYEAKDQGRNRVIVAHPDRAANGR